MLDEGVLVRALLEVPPPLLVSSTAAAAALLAPCCSALVQRTYERLLSTKLQIVYLQDFVPRTTRPLGVHRDFSRHPDAARVDQWSKVPNPARLDNFLQ